MKGIKEQSLISLFFMPLVALLRESLNRDHEKLPSVRTYVLVLPMHEKRVGLKANPSLCPGQDSNLHELMFTTPSK